MKKSNKILFKSIQTSDRLAQLVKAPRWLKANVAGSIPAVISIVNSHCIMLRGRVSSGDELIKIPDDILLQSKITKYLQFDNFFSNIIKTTKIILICLKVHRL